MFSFLTVSDYMIIIVSSFVKSLFLLILHDEVERLRGALKVLSNAIAFLQIYAFELSVILRRRDRHEAEIATR